jgi:3-hydroxyisobutyrate dehydrogenase
MMSKNLRVGWIGTGVMGGPMAGHLLAAGYPLTVFNRTKAKAEKLLSAGAKWAATPAAVARVSDIVFTIVGFPQDVREVFLGPQGLCRGWRKGQLLVDMTTSPPGLAIELAEQGAKEGVLVLDAPVSGGQVGAEKAKLTVFVGGARQGYEKILPLLQKLGQTCTYFGPAGSGQHAKLVNQILIAGNMLGLAEGLSYARKCGIDPQLAVDAIAPGAAGSFLLSFLGPRMLKGDFAAGFYVDHFVKDLGLALAEAKRLQLPLPMLALAEQLYIALQAQGQGRLGTQALLKVYETPGTRGSSPGKRASCPPS